MEKRKTLLEKYDIPLHHLDFAYVEKCQNAREMEKIVQILRSGEEGYFPDLTRCAEEKLKELKPDSKLFRFEEKIRQSDVLNAQELKPIYDWTHDIKTKDNALNELKKDGSDMAVDSAPLRTPGKIDTEQKKPTATEKPQAKTKPNEQRIKSTDYSKWDKYDPDVELLRMDLDEERAKEALERRNSPNEAQPHMVLCEQGAADQRMQAHLKKLSQLEREEYAEKFRLRGNEFFRAKEYESAIKEYDRAIIYDPPNAVRAYNNRAVSQMKLKNYVAAIADCELCLQLEPSNVKARLRLADASYAQGRRRESYDLYQKVLELEPQNPAAVKAIAQLQAQLGDLAPSHATRLAIEEHTTATAAPCKAAPPAKPATVPTPTPAKEYDLAELVKPNRVIKSKLLNAAEALGKIKGSASAAPQKSTATKQSAVEAPKMRLPSNQAPNPNKLLIQEL